MIAFIYNYLGGNKKFWLCLFTVLTFPLSPVLAAAGDGATSCKASSSNELLRCITENHPSLKAVKLKAERKEDLIGVAEQRPNPELDSQLFFGKSGGESQFQPQITLTHTLELGGKRGARIDKAKAQAGVDTLSYEQLLAGVIVTSVVQMHRLRQLSEEGAILEKAISVFESVIRRFSSKPALTPENEASLKIFQLAVADQRLKKSTLEQERPMNSEHRSLSFCYRVL